MIPVKKETQVLDTVRLCCYSNSFAQEKFTWSPLGRGWYGGQHAIPGIYKEYIDIDENKPFADLLPEHDDDDEEVEETGEPSWSDIGMRIVEVEPGKRCLVNVCRG
jgi:hypothetical protein